MPKIHTITTDTEVNGSDKLLGSDSSAGTKNHTKNYLINDLKTFMLDSDDLQSFKTIAVSGQSSVVADAKADTLTLAEGSNVTITTDPNTDTVTIASTDTTYTAGDGLDLTSTEFSVDTTVVRTSGAQSIAGVKSFTDTAKFVKGEINFTPTSDTIALDIRGTGTPNDFFTVSNATGGSDDVFLPTFFYKAATYGYEGGTNRYPSGTYGGGFIAAVDDTSYPSGVGAGAAMHFNSRVYTDDAALSNRNLFSWGSWLTTRMVMTAGGNLLIGTTTNNGDKLQVSGSATITGTITGDLTGDVTGDLTGDVTGDVTGNLTGNVTGNVTGNLTGNPTVTEISFSSTLGKIKEASVTVSSVDLLALNNGGNYTLIAAPGTNRAIVPMSITMSSDPGATAFNFNEDLYVGHENEVSSTSTDFFALVGAGFVNSSTIAFRHFPVTKAANEHVDIRVNDPLVLHATNTATVTAGNGDLKVKIIYREVDFT